MHIVGRGRVAAGQDVDAVVDLQQDDRQVRSGIDDIAARDGYAGAFFPAIAVIINQAGPRFAGWFLGVRLNQGYTIPKTLPDQAEFTAASTYFPLKSVHP